MKVVVCGITRSGTTLLCRFVNSLPGAFCVSEPHEELLAYGRLDSVKASLSLKRDIDILEGVSANLSDALPLHGLMERLHGVFRIVGFKETFKDRDVYKDTRCVHSDVLERYASRLDYHFLFIVRRPIPAWNSVKERAWAKLGNLDRFIRNWKLFYTFMKRVYRPGLRPIVYEQFVADPVKEFSEKTGISASSVTMPLPRMPIHYGDVMGANSTHIGPSHRQDITSTEEVDAIKQAGLEVLYEQALRLPA